MDVKTCTKCSQSFPADLNYFYKNSGGKFGVTPRCKPCVNEDNRLGFEKRKEENPDRIRLQQNARTKKSYFKNLEENQRKGREWHARRRADPETYAIIQARKRGGGAGLTPEQIESMRIMQNDQCAICSDPNPTDLDHCHKTGQIRWLLCRHCNRGLGAFKDEPELLRKAADMLESIINH